MLRASTNTQEGDYPTMTTLKSLRLILGLIMILASFAVVAHQPVLNSEIENSKKSPYLIDEPEIW